MLDRDLSYKPLDFGNGLVAGSVNARGQLVALNISNAVHGYATLTGAGPFPDDRWYDQAFVRQYRAGLAAPDLPGFGFNFGQGDPPDPECSFPVPAIPLVELTPVPGLNLEILTFAPWAAGEPAPAAALQIVKVHSQPTAPARLDYRWSGALALVRASYAQLTEGGPLPLPPDEYSFTVIDGILGIENHGLGQAVALLVGEFNNSGQLTGVLGDWKVTPVNGGHSLDISLTGSLSLEENRNPWLAVIYGFGRDRESARAQVLDLVVANLERLLDRTVERWQPFDRIIETAGLEKTYPGAAWLVRQALAYNLACCPVPVGDRATCIITDHQLLPLSWNRDSYWQVQAFLALRKQAQNPALSLSTAQEVTAWLDELVRRHLTWLFEVAERPQDAWGRAYLTNGRCKDLVFQLDQQCYPLLELADYLEATGDLAITRRLKPRLESSLEDLLARKAPQAWLFPTSETPADDKVDMPYNFSCQLNAWRVLTRLASLNLVDSYSPAQLQAIADRVRRDIYRYMVAEYQGRPVFAYLTDLAGNYRFYHDANDWPTILAPAWGFCSQDNQVWRNTLDFAFSAANSLGYYPGTVGGLGSVHSPHPWPLGSIQELYLARLFKDDDRSARTWANLGRMVCWDGNFPEAIDENNGKVASRHWFGWPGAMLTIALLASNDCTLLQQYNG